MSQVAGKSGPGHHPETTDFAAKDMLVPEHVVKPEYENGMKIAYDAASGRVVVSFRGRLLVMPESCPTHDEGIAVGERYCRSHGWIPEKKKALRRPW